MSQKEFDFGQYRQHVETTTPPWLSKRGHELDQKTEQADRRNEHFAAYSQKQAEPKTTSSSPILSTDSVERKATPLFSGCIAYFPLALAAVARHSKRSNDKHNPGEPLHWAREKSDDHADCAARHLVDINHFNAELNEYEEAAAHAWRSLAHLQLLEEMRLGR